MIAIQPETRILVIGLPDPMVIFDFFFCNLKEKMLKQKIQKYPQDKVYL